MAQISAYRTILPDLNNSAFHPLIESIGSHDAESISTDQYSLIHWGDPLYKDYPVHSILQDKKSIFGRSYILFDKGTETIYASTDRMGLFPIFIFKKDKRLFIANSIPAMEKIAHDYLQPNIHSILDLLAYGHFFKNRTTFTNVRTMMPGETITFYRAGETETKRQIIPSTSTESWNFNRAIDALVASVENLFSLNEDVLMHITSGLDTRLILAAAIANNKKPLALVTYGPSNSQNAQISQDIAELLDIPLYKETQPIENPYDSIEKAALASGGSLALQHTNFILNQALLEKTKNNILALAAGGKIWRAVYYDKEKLSFSFRHFISPKYAEQCIYEQYRPTIEPFCKAFPDLAAKYQNTLQANIARWVYKKNKRMPAHLMDGFYISEYMQHFTIPRHQLLNSWYAHSYPLMHHDVLDAFHSMPIRYRLKSTFHCEAIKKLSPALASIKWDRIMQPVTQNIHWYPKLPFTLHKSTLWKNEAKLQSQYYQDLASPYPIDLLYTLLKQSDIPITKDTKDYLSHQAKGQALMFEIWIKKQYPHLVDS